jgi:hypothetical protein
MPEMLTDSPDLVPVPAVEPDKAVVLDASLHGSWEDMFTAHPRALHYLLSPDNYEGWGPLKIPPSLGPASGRLRTIRYYNPRVHDHQHPVRRACHALVASLMLQGEHTNNWVVQGLTVSRPAADCAIEGGASNITVDFCLIDCPRVRGCRVRNVSHCTIQRCVIRESIQATEGDTVGIQVRQHTAAEMLGIKILDNEIYNVGDGIQLTAHKDDPLRPVEVLMEGNDIYLEPSRYLGDSEMTRDENAIDLKVGSDRPESTIVRKNRMWGFRRRKGSGAQGELLVVQKFCRNLVVEGNIMGDAPRGMKDENWPRGKDDPKKEPDTSRCVVVRNNQFHDIRDLVVNDDGAITRPITAGVRFEGNWFARSDYIADATPPAYKGLPVYADNIRIGATQVQRPHLDDDGNPEPNDPAVPYSEPPNRHVFPRWGYDTYERRRWTGPELVRGAIPAPPPTHRPPGDQDVRRPDGPS